MAPVAVARAMGGAEPYDKCGAAAADDLEAHTDSGDEMTPSTTESECSEVTPTEEWESEESPGVTERVEPQLGPGLFPTDIEECDSACECDEREELALAPIAPSGPGHYAADAAAAAEGTLVRDAEEAAASSSSSGANFTREETLFVFDWDDTILPSTWLQRQGLRLDSGSVVTAPQRERLAEVAVAAAQTLRLAKERGTVVLLTNAERGWIELSCQKFIPMLLPIIENVKIVSARTTYETERCTSPLQWKALAFQAEIARACGLETLADPTKRKNIHSLGDSVHEREALMRATAGLPNCFTKCLKFVDRPDISQILSQHFLVAHSFEDIVQHGDNLDLTINCS